MNYGLPYQGNKSRIAERLGKCLPPAGTFVDLFCGGCAMARWRLGLALNGKSRKPRKPKKDHNSKVVKFDGQYYPSITAMARELGLPFAKARALVEDQVV